MALMRKEEITTPGITGVSVGQTHTILGPESSFDGKLSFQGTVRIDGKFSGEIVTNDTLVVGESAEVTANVEVGALVLNGTLRGNVVAKREVALHTPARLYGDIQTPILVIHQGVIFEGNCRMENLDRPRVLTSEGAKDAKADAKPAAPDDKGDEAKKKADAKA